MKVAVLSANLGGYDQPHVHMPQHVPDGVSVEFYTFTDENFPPRPKAMTSRLQAGIPKWWGWQMVPGFDVYIWVDASCRLTAGAVWWFLSHLDHVEIAVFRHPERNSIREEVDFMLKRMARPGETYLNARYAGEDIVGQYAYIASDLFYPDVRLYASTAFAYRPTRAIRDAFQDVWSAKARWLLHDQLIFPYALWKRDCAVHVIDQNYLKCQALEFVRTGVRRSA